MVSVVIPTIGRPRYLRRAVESALAALPPGEVEVIVVPNGPDRSWRESLAGFTGPGTPTVLPLEQANANAARNLGLAAATGEYVRFLDDDDFLYPDAARRQYDLLEGSGADLCSGAVDCVTASGEIYLRTHCPAREDFVLAMLLPRRRGLPVMHVFRRRALGDVRWCEPQPFLQDIRFLLDVCAAAERKWATVDEAVGAWQHHREQRISDLVSVHGKQAEMLRMLRETIQALDAAGRLSPERRAAAAAGLWDCVHQAYYCDPRYWADAARQVMTAFPGTRPDIGLYRWRAAQAINPILVESALVPKRWFNHLARLAAYRLRG